MRKKLIVFLFFIIIIQILCITKKDFAESQKNIEATMEANPSTTTSVKSGDIITYSIKLKNVSDKKYTSSRLILSIPKGTKFVSVNKSFEQSDFYITAKLGNINPGQEVITELKLQVTGTTDEIKFPGAEYLLLNSEYTLFDLIMAALSEEFLSAVTADERQEALGDIACTDDLVLSSVHKLEDEPEVIESEKYKIENSMIKNVAVNTTVKELLSNITNKSENEIKVYKEEKEVLEDENLATSMELNVNNRNYIIIVQGDINEDGKQSALDLSLLKGYIIKNYDFVENKLAASDINGDGEITLTDLSKLKMQLVGLSIKE